MSKLDKEYIAILHSWADMNTKISQLKELTEQECIGFAEWITQGVWSYFDGKTWTDSDKIITSKELFQLYLKSKENE